MNITVFAANGRSGKAFVYEALEAGHAVIAAVHGSNPFEPHDRLKVITCDITNEQQVTAALEGAEAVTSFVGHVQGSDFDLQTVGIKTILKAMQVAKLRRLISLTGTGVRFEGDKASLIDTILNMSIRLIDPKRISDGIAHGAVLKESNTDWTLLRVLKLTDGLANSYKLTPHGPAKVFVSRKTVAKAALELLEKKEFIQEAPIISAI
jgi:nucleoside-diphosphate-sugar epimerase